MYEILSLTIESILDKEESLKEKIDILDKLSKENLGRVLKLSSYKISEIYGELLTDDNIQIDRKITIMRNLASNRSFRCYINLDCQDKIVDLVLNNFNNIGLKEKLNLIFDLGVNDKYNYSLRSEAIRELQDTVNFSENIVSKSGMINKIYYGSNINEFVSNIELANYCKVGQYYTLLVNDNNYGYFNKSGKLVYEKEVKRWIDKDGNIEYSQCDLPVDKIKSIEEKLEEINNLCDDKCGFNSFNLLGDDVVVMNYCFDDESIERKNYSKAYTIESDGSLRLLEIGEKMRLTDDKPELEIKLEEATQNIKTSQMVDAINNIQEIMLKKTYNKEEQEGEIKNV